MSRIAIEMIAVGVDDAERVTIGCDPDTAGPSGPSNDTCDCVPVCIQRNDALNPSLPAATATLPLREMVAGLERGARHVPRLRRSRGLLYGRGRAAAGNHGHRNNPQQPGKTRWPAYFASGRNRASVAFNCSESGSRANAAAHTLRAWL